MIKHLIGEYRQTAEGGPRDYPTPSEYIRWEQLLLDWTKDNLWKENIFLHFVFECHVSGSFWIVWKRNTIKEPSILQHSTIGDLSINSAPFVSSTSGGRRWKQTLYNLPPYLIIFLCRIYSRLEENDEDALYFFTKAGLGSDFELVRENVQGEKGKAANMDMTHERST